MRRYLGLGFGFGFGVLSSAPGPSGREVFGGHEEVVGALVLDGKHRRDLAEISHGVRPSASPHGSGRVRCESFHRLFHIPRVRSGQNPVERRDRGLAQLQATIRGIVVDLGRLARAFELRIVQVVIQDFEERDAPDRPVPSAPFPALPKELLKEAEPHENMEKRNARGRRPEQRDPFGVGDPSDGGHDDVRDLEREGSRPVLRERLAIPQAKERHEHDVDHSPPDRELDSGNRNRDHAPEGRHEDPAEKDREHQPQRSLARALKVRPRACPDAETERDLDPVSPHGPRNFQRNGEERRSSGRHESREDLDLTEQDQHEPRFHLVSVTISRFFPGQDEEANGADRIRRREEHELDPFERSHFFFLSFFGRLSFEKKDPTKRDLVFFFEMAFENKKR
jgi:hypothetical protein